MLAIILAAGAFISYPSPTNPTHTITVHDEFSMPESALSPRQQIIDQGFMERPMLDRMPADPYSEVEQRFPVRTVVPRAQRQQLSTEDAMALQDYRTKRMAEKTAIEGRILSQTIAEKNFENEQSIIRQAEMAIPRLSRVDPKADDFDEQVALINEEFPLASQNPGIQQMIGNLANSRNRFTQNKEILMRGAQDQDAREEYANRRTEEEIMTTLAQYGPEAIAIYQENLKPDESGFITPRRQIEAFAAASGYINRAKAAQIEEKPMTPKERQAYELDLLKERNAIQKRKAEMLTTEGDDIALQYLDRKLREMGVDIPETPSAAPASAIPEGKTATNPQTGEKIIFRSGKWEPIK